MLAHPGDVHFAHVEDMPAGAKLSSVLLGHLATSDDGNTNLRKLGVSQPVPVSGVIISFAGNNIAIGGDFARRVMPIELYWRGQCRPEDRTDFATHRPLTPWASKRRPAILAACHTILLRALQDDTPELTATIGSFEEWCQTILRSLTDLFLPDDDYSVADMALADMGAWKAEHDTSRTEWESFFGWWVRAFGGDRVPAAVVAGALDPRVESGLPPMDCEIPQALFAQMETHGRTDIGARRAVGTALSGVLGAPFDVEGIAQVELRAATSRGVRRYHLVRLDGQELPAAEEDHRGAF
jgi:hypothetical protein